MRLELKERWHYIMILYSKAWKEGKIMKIFKLCENVWPKYEKVKNTGTDLSVYRSLQQSDIFLFLKSKIQNFIANFLQICALFCRRVTDNKLTLTQTPVRIRLSALTNSSNI